MGKLIVFACGNSELATATGVDIASLKRIVGSLSAVKGFTVLKRTPKAARISETDVVELDLDFKHPKRVSVCTRLFQVVGFCVYDSMIVCSRFQEIQLPTPTYEDPKERGTSAAVADDRKYTVDACIVRTMKMRNEMTHQVCSACYWRVCIGFVSERRRCIVVKNRRWFKKSSTKFGISCQRQR